MTCTNGTCEYNPTLRRSATTTTPQQRLEALTFLYNARNQCLQENRQDLAIQFQQEINKIERGDKP